MDSLQKQVDTEPLTCQTGEAENAETIFRIISTVPLFGFSCMVIDHLKKIDDAYSNDDGYRVAPA